MLLWTTKVHSSVSCSNVAVRMQERMKLQTARIPNTPGITSGTVSFEFLLWPRRTYTCLVVGAQYSLHIRRKQQPSYFGSARGGPLTRCHLRFTPTSTRSAILMKGMPLFMPYSLRSKAIIPEIVPDSVPFPETVSVNLSCFLTPRIVKSPSTEKSFGPVCSLFLDLKRMSGFSLTSKKSLPFSLPFFIPLPVFTLSA